jgi:hypothetical protein
MSEIPGRGQNVVKARLTLNHAATVAACHNHRRFDATADLTHMAQIAAHIAQNPRRRALAARWNLAGLLLKLAMGAVVLLLAGCPVAYILWPRFPDPVALDAPALPITVGRLALNIKPAAIRIPVQRHPGAHERVDLAFLWPSLAPPDPAAKSAPGETPQHADRIFLTIAISDSTPPPVERLKTIYPRYTVGEPTARPDGLLVQGFRNDTPYQGEDVLYEANAPEKFLIRCTRKSGMAPGTCMHERRIAGADITVRFPRDWLNDWRAVAGNIDRLIASLRPNVSR